MSDDVHIALDLAPARNGPSGLDHEMVRRSYSSFSPSTSIYGRHESSDHVRDGEHPHRRLHCVVLATVSNRAEAPPRAARLDEAFRRLCRRLRARMVRRGVTG